MSETNPSTKDVAAAEASSVAQDAKASGQQVAGTAKSEAVDVANHAKNQALDLFQSFRDEATTHAGEQSRRLGETLRSLADELREMADGSQQAGPAAGLARQAADTVHTVAARLEDSEPGDLLEDVRRFARRRPGAFLAAAAAVGLVGGRLTRSLQAGAPEPEPTWSASDHASTDLRTRHLDGDVAATGGAGYGRTPATPAPAVTSTAEIDVVGQTRTAATGTPATGQDPLGGARR